MALTTEEMAILAINAYKAEIKKLQEDRDRLYRKAVALEEVFHEVERATAKFPTWPTDPLHALAVLGEEFGELTKSVVEHIYEPEKSSDADVRKEAIQTAAMAVRFLMSLNRYWFKRCEQHDQDADGARDWREGGA